MCRGQGKLATVSNNEKAIKKIQKSLGLPETGVADEATISLLLERIKSRPGNSEDSRVEIDWDGWQI